MESNKYLFTKEELDALIADERAAEREACAQACETLQPVWSHLEIQKACFEDAARAIRARGQQ